VEAGLNKPEAQAKARMMLPHHSVRDVLRTRSSQDPFMSRHRFGRLLQVLGMLILPFGIASELVGKVGLGQSMLIAAGGTLVFYTGYVIQHR
jgi:hypothetical protein